MTENIYGVDCEISHIPKKGKLKKAFTFFHREGEITIIGRKQTEDAILEMLCNNKPTFNEYIESEKAIKYPKTTFKPLE